MIKGLILFGLTVVISFGSVIQCKNGKKICMVIKEEPLYKRIYFVNMTDKDIRVNSGIVYGNGRMKKIDNRVFRRYSKTVVMQVERKRHPITDKIIDPYVGYSNFNYSVMN